VGRKGVKRRAAEKEEWRRRKEVKARKRKVVEGEANYARFEGTITGRDGDGQHLTPTH
jgi:hypothetical protein